MSKITTIQNIWDPSTISECIKISEEEVTLDQVRRASGMEIDTESGLRYYFVPKQKA